MRLLTVGRKVKFAIPYTEVVLEVPFPDFEPPEFVKFEGTTYRRAEDGVYRWFPIFEWDRGNTLLIHHGTIEDEYVSTCGKYLRGARWGCLTDNEAHVTCPDCKVKLDGRRICGCGQPKSAHSDRGSPAPFHYFKERV